MGEHLAGATATGTLVLLRFGDIATAGIFVLLTHPYSTLILGLFSLHQIAHVVTVVVSLRISYSAAKLFSKNSNFQPM